MSYPDKTRNIASQVNHGVQLDGAFAPAEFRPREQRQAQIDGRGIEGVGGLIQRHGERIIGIKATRLADQDVSEVGVDAPVSIVVGVRKSASRYFASKARVIQFGTKYPKAGFEIAKAISASQLGVSHAKKLIEARKPSQASLTTVTLHAFVEFVPGKEVQELSENRSAEVHDPSLFRS